MTWRTISSQGDLEEAISTSYTSDVVIFKHSTTCSISHMAKLRLESGWSFADNIIPYYLDLKQYRTLSNEIAERFNVAHESPQILLIRKGECIYDASHFDISVEELKETLAWHA